MLLLLVRHALAADRDAMAFPDDSARPLVPKGKKTFRRVARQLAAAGFVPTTILSSPWKRAWQTAGILAEETGLDKAARMACPALAQDPGLDLLATAVGAREANEVVALVGHEPWLSELGSLLLTGSGTRLAIDFPKSGVLGVELTAVGPAAGRLRFFLHPRSTG
jgi:phosphohistidine phosphatase